VCCDICTTVCACGSSGCVDLLEHPSKDNDSDCETDEESIHSSVSPAQMDILRESLRSYQSVVRKPSALSDITAHTDVVIEEIFHCCHLITCPDDIMERCSIFSLTTALAVHDIILASLGDDSSPAGSASDEDSDAPDDV
jgi:hypothetical protein